jgi:uncharacterized phosphosugar-binding protein
MFPHFPLDANYAPPVLHVNNVSRLKEHNRQLVDNILLENEIILPSQNFSW